MAVQCEIPPALYQAQPYPNGLTLHHVMTVVSAVCTFATVVLCFFLFEQHLVRYVCPEQQKHLARIAILPAVFAIFHLFGTIFYDSSQYLQPFPQLYEAIAICSLFESYVAYASAGVPDDAAARFRHVARVGRYAEKKHGPLLLRINFICLYQLPFVSLACLIATEVTSAVQCKSSTAYRSNQIIIRLVGTASTITALVQLITFHIFVRRELTGTRALRKLIGIKILAAVVIAETVVFGFVKPGMTRRWPHASYFDITVGIANVLVCIEMVLFALGWLYLFGSSSVKRAAHTESISALTAFGQVINISDIGLNAWVALTAKIGREDKYISSDAVSSQVKNEDGKF